MFTFYSEKRDRAAEVTTVVQRQISSPHRNAIYIHTYNMPDTQGIYIYTCYIWMGCTSLGLNISIMSVTLYQYIII